MESSVKTVMLKTEKNHLKMVKGEPENIIRRAHLVQLKKKCLTFGPQGRHYLGRVLRELRACGGEKKTSTKRTVGWTIAFTNQQDEIDSPPEEDDSEPSEAESDDRVAKRPLNIRRFFLPSDSDDDEEHRDC